MRERFIADGKWYYTLTIATVGLFAWVPFLHGAAVTHDPKLRWRALQYGVAAAVVATLVGLAPTDELGEPVGLAGNAMSTIGAIAAIALIVFACIQLRPLRHRAFGINDPHRLPPSASDVAVEGALAARKRREEARALVERDPALARDLGIGRPDRSRDYDDGGLVDLNHANAETIAEICGLGQSTAQRLVEVRSGFSDGFAFVDEAIAYAELSERDERLLRDRAIVLPV